MVAVHLRTGTIYEARDSLMALGALCYTVPGPRLPFQENFTLNPISNAVACYTYILIFITLW